MISTKPAAASSQMGLDQCVSGVKAGALRLGERRFAARPAGVELRTARLLVLTEFLIGQRDRVRLVFVQRVQDQISGVGLILGRLDAWPGGLLYFDLVLWVV